MRIKHTFLVGLLLYWAILEGAGRSASWRIEALPGAHRMALADIDQIVLPKGVGEPLHLAVDDLIELAAGSGQHLRLAADTSAKQAFVLEVDPKQCSSVSDGGFLIHRERTRVIVRAATEEGLLNGLYAIAKDWYGARWYWQGELGLEFANEPVEKVPEGLWRDAPAFIHRQLHPANTEWGRRNRLVRHYGFNHNLARIFDRELYSADPEVFSLVNGRRVAPAENAGTDSQPDFSNPRTVEIAAEAVIEHFKLNPESVSFSLSINDNVRFDESAMTELMVTPVQYFRQRPDYTNLVFGFMNSVASRLDQFDAKRKVDGARQRGDGESERFAPREAKGSESGCPLGERGAKWNRLRSASFASQEVDDEWRSIWETESGEPRFLTALSYYWTEQSPQIPIHPRVMPVLTSDRAQWHDPDYRVQDRELIKRWADSGAERIATWDYYFGAPYPYPRQFNQWMDESLKYLHGEGVDVFFSQLPSAWGLDGPKAWLASELLWDPEQDADALLSEFYANFFGPAAEPMRQFYELAESHRNANEGKADWIKFYKDEAGIEMMLPVLPALRGFIDQAAAVVDSDSKYAARIQVVSDAFQFTEYYADVYARRLALLMACLSRQPVGGLAQDFLAARERYLEYSKALFEDPMHKRLSAFGRLAQSDPMSLAVMTMGEAPEPERYQALWHVANYYQRFGGEPVFAEDPLQHKDVRWRKQSFLGPALPRLERWWFSFRPYENFKVEPSLGFTDRGVRMSGADMCSFFTDIEVIPGQGYVFEFEADYRVSPDNRTHLILHWHDADDRKLEAVLPMQFPNGESEQTVSVEVPMLAPQSAARLRISFLVSRQYQGDYLDVRRVSLFKVQ